MLAADRITLKGRLRAVDAVLRRGQVTAICGPNGAGKSTLLSVFAGLLVPDKGTVTLDGHALAELEAKTRARRIGYLPQEGEIAWDLTVSSLVSLGRLPHGDADAGPVDAAIAALELEALAQRQVSKISGGERARALLGRVLAGEPEWILADEPLAALDLAHQLSLIAHLRHAANGGVGVVIVVHDLALAMNYADHVIVLDKGRLVTQGAPEAALSEKLIASVWGVEAQWLGRAGARALTVGA